MHEHGFEVNGIDFEMAGRREMSDDLEIIARHARIVQNAEGWTIAMQDDFLVIGHFERGRLAFRSNEFAANR